LLEVGVGPSEEEDEPEPREDEDPGIMLTSSSSVLEKLPVSEESVLLV
jgi:hypothetical protein